MTVDEAIKLIGELRLLYVKHNDCFVVERWPYGHPKDNQYVPECLVKEMLDKGILKKVESRYQWADAYEVVK